MFTLRHAWHHVAPQQKCKLAEPARHVKEEMDFGNVNSIEWTFLVMQTQVSSVFTFYVQTISDTFGKPGQEKDARRIAKADRKLLGLQQYCAPYQDSAVFPHKYQKGNRRGVRTQRAPLDQIKTCIGCLLQFGENTLATYRTAENIVSCEYFVHISSYFTTNACFELCEFARACSLPKDPLTTAVWRISLAFLSFRPGSWDS